VWDENGGLPGGRVHVCLRSVDGAVLGESSWPVDEAVGHPRPVGTLAVASADRPADAVVVWDLVWEDAEGRVLDREVVLASTGVDFAPLLDLPRATLEVVAEPDCVRVRHRAGPLVVGLQLLDDRPPDASGRVIVDGDPRPLLPGESRTFAVRADAPARLLLESWNTEPVHLDLPIKEKTA
jgi:beta-mannosidase